MIIWDWARVRPAAGVDGKNSAQKHPARGSRSRELMHMGKRRTGFPLDYTDKIRQALIAGGLYKLARKGLGRGLIGLALPAAALIIEDLSNPRGVILPFVRWLMSRHGKVKIIEISTKPLQKPGKAGQNAGWTTSQGKSGGE